MLNPHATACMDKPRTALVRDEIREIAAYHVPDSRGLVKLDAMENPYALPAELRVEVGRIAAEASLNRYPDPRADALKTRLRETMQLPAGTDVLLGNGSDELIQILALALARPGAVMLSAEPTFVMFRMVARYTGLRYVGVPLADGFSLDLPALEAAIAAHRPALIFLAYPNNPTGNLFADESIERVVRAAPGLVVVDEAYHIFAGRSFLSRLARYPNLLVMRTLSKLGLAGLRLGWIAGHSHWLAELDKVRLPYNINVLSQRIAEHLLGRLDVLEAQATLIRAERQRVHSVLAGLPGVRVYPSDANFLLLRVAHGDAAFSGLRSRGVLVKNLNGAHPMLVDCLRVTIGTPQENDRFIEALSQALPQAA